MSHIFISYSKHDKLYARSLADNLLERGFDVWIDDRIDYGEDWELTMFAAIDEAAAFLIIMTPESYASKWVRRECHHAEKRQKPPFPVLLDGEEFPRYALDQYVDIREGKTLPEEFFERLATKAPRNATSGKDVTVFAVGIPTKSDLAARPEAAQKIWRGAPGNLLWTPEWVGQIIPAPFAWVEIPAGKVHLGYRDGSYIPEDGLIVDVPRFAIAKYPITVAQFQVFIQEGYADPVWWDFSDQSRQWRKTHHQPQELPIFARPDHPRTHVTWYESVAFSRWLASKTNTPAMLPGEAEWQRSAQGDDRREYPWGNKLDAGRCNYGSHGTTAVTEYEGTARGDSPYGVTDLCGNVYEWCSTAWDEGGDDISSPAFYRVRRGGSWVSNENYMRVASRYKNTPDSETESVGFRCARALE